MGNPAFTAMRARDAALFAAGDFSSAVVTASGTSVRGTLTTRTVYVDQGGAMIETRRKSLRVTGPVAQAIANGELITVDGLTHRVDYREAVPPDGLLVDLMLVGGAE